MSTSPSAAAGTPPASLIPDKALVAFQDAKSKKFLSATTTDGKTEGPATLVTVDASAAATQTPTFEYVQSDQSGYGYLKFAGAQFLKVDPLTTPVSHQLVLSNTNGPTADDSERANFLFAVSPSEQADSSTGAATYTVFAFTAGVGNLHVNSGGDTLYFNDPSSDPNELHFTVLLQDAVPAPAPSQPVVEQPPSTTNPVTQPPPSDNKSGAADEKKDSVASAPAPSAPSASAGNKKDKRRAKRVAARAAALAAGQAVDPSFSAALTNDPDPSEASVTSRWILFGFIIGITVIVLILMWVGWGFWAGTYSRAVFIETRAGAYKLPPQQSTPAMMSQPAAETPPSTPPPSPSSSSSAAAAEAEPPSTPPSQVAVSASVAPTGEISASAGPVSTTGTTGGYYAGRGYPSLFGSGYAHRGGAGHSSGYGGGYLAPAPVTSQPQLRYGGSGSGATATTTGRLMGAGGGGTQPWPSSVHSRMLAGSGGSLTIQHPQMTQAPLYRSIRTRG